MSDRATQTTGRKYCQIGPGLYFPEILDGAVKDVRQRRRRNIKAFR
jgi:hypothetical protein